MIGSILALFSAMGFALNSIFLRRVVLRVPDVTVGILISVPMAVPLLFLVMVPTEGLASLAAFSYWNLTWLALAGVLHFAMGRTLSYGYIQMVGANIGNILSRSDILISVVIGVGLLNDPLRWHLAVGVFLIIAGVVLTGLGTRQIYDPYWELARIPVRALLLGLGAGFCWGISPILVKLGLRGVGSPIAGAFISFLAASLFLGLSLPTERTRRAISQTSAMAAGLFFIAGSFSFAANFVRYVALKLAPASVVTPLASTVPVFVLLFSFIFNRKLEIFNRPVIIGAFAVVIGTLFLV